MQLPLVLIGAGPLGANIARIAQRTGQFSVAGFVDDRAVAPPGWNSLGGDAVLPSLAGRGIRHAAVCIGDPARRLQVAEQLAGMGFEFPALLHPLSDVGPDVSLGKGVVVFAGTYVGPGARLEDFVIVEANVCVGHHAQLGRGALIGSHATLGPNTTVAETCILGIGSRCHPGTVVPPGTRIPAFAEAAAPQAG